PPISSNFTQPLKRSGHLPPPIKQNCTSHRGGYSHDAVVYALTHCGVRHIDTAKHYGCEEKLGKAIKESGLPRSDLWITNKVWSEDYGYKAAKKACLGSCSEMGLEYFDLYLMHWPDPQKPGCSNREMRAETWRALEELYKEGVCRAIGVSNFVIRHLEQLKEDCSVVPHVNQVFAFFFFCERLQFRMAQEVEWGITEGVFCILRTRKGLYYLIIPDLNVFGFQLEDDDMAALTSLHDGRHVTWDPTNVE
uniref:Zgc:110366 n=1 Tax=Acanthochromis polyacanthus TaxID=80966 RepID=A0A3Q1H1C3_9TELE